jgi:arylsulfatase A-like enzyme
LWCSFPTTAISSIKVPAFIRWPHHIVGGSIDRRLSANVDLMPTILNAAKVTPALVYPMDGRDLFDPSWDRRFMLTEHWHENTRTANPWAPTWASVRSTSEHYIEYFSHGNVIYREHYNLRTDPAELSNTLVGRQGGKGPHFTFLHGLIAQARTCVGPDCP